VTKLDPRTLVTTRSSVVSFRQLRRTYMHKAPIFLPSKMQRIRVVLIVSMLQMVRCSRGVAAFVRSESRPIVGSQSQLRLSFLYQQSRLFLHSESESTSTVPNKRAEILHEQLCLVGVNADGVHHAALRSIEDPTSGYDSDFGKSAIRTYRAFLYPKNKDELEDALMLKVSAGRSARQIDFLIKRHLSHQTEWVRHHDTIRDRREVFPLILILDNLRSAFNVGSLYRTADAAGCQAVLTCGITPHPNGSGADKLTKSAILDTLEPRGKQSSICEKMSQTTLSSVWKRRSKAESTQVCNTAKKSR
jgi:hypothetical protein